MDNPILNQHNDNKNLLENLLTNFNDTLFRSLIKDFNRTNYNFFYINYNNPEINEILQHSFSHLKIKMVVVGGKSINYHLPIKYIDVSQANPEINLFDDPRTNIISFDYDIHLVIYNTITNRVEYKDQILNQLQHFLEEQDIETDFVPADFIDYCNHISLHFTNLGINRCLNNYIYRHFYKDGNLNDRGELMKYYFNNIIKVFNEHEDNIDPNIIISPINNINLYKHTTGIVNRIIMPITYQIGPDEYVNKPFILADFQWDGVFKIGSHIWRESLRGLCNYAVDQDNGNLLSFLDESDKNKIRTANYDLLAMPLNEINLLDIDGLLTVPLNVCLLNTIYFAHPYKSPPYIYPQFKKTRNQNKYNKIISKFYNNDNQDYDIDLNTRYFDKILHHWRYETHNALRLSHLLPVIVPNIDNILHNFYRKFNFVGILNNFLSIEGYGDECLFIGNQDLSFYDILTKDNINLIVNSLGPGVVDRYNAQYDKIVDDILLKDTVNNDTDTNHFLDENNLFSEFKNDSLANLQGFINANVDIRRAIQMWKIDALKKRINYLLITQIPDVDMHPSEYENQLQPFINSLDRLFTLHNQNESEINNLIDNHPRSEIFDNENIKNILSLFPTAKWFLTYRITTYFNIKNMSSIDHNNIEFYKGQSFKQSIFTSTSFSPYYNWSRNYEPEDPYYIFEYVINAKSRFNYIFINNVSNLNKSEVLINRDIVFIILDINTKNVLIEDGDTKKIRTKYIITVLVANQDELYTILSNVNEEVLNFENENVWIDFNEFNKEEEKKEDKKGKKVKNRNR